MQMVLLKHLSNCLASFIVYEKGAEEYPFRLLKYKPLLIEMLDPIVGELKDFDAVHFTTRQFRKWEDQLLVVALRFAKVKVVIAEPGSIENDVVDNVDAYIVPSTLAKQHMELIRPRIPTFVLRPFVDKAQYERYWPIRQRLHNQNKNRRLNIVYLGRLASVKSPGMFLKVVNIISNAWKRLQAEQGPQNYHPDVAFRFVGSGPLKKSLQMAISRMSINVSFYSCLHEDLPSYLSKNVDIVVHTTLLNESFGLSNLEAMAAEIPVVTFGVGGTNEYLSLHSGNNQRGVIVQFASAERMALSIISLMTNMKLRRSIGIAAREHVFKKKSPYLIANMVKQYRQYLRGLLCQAHMKKNGETCTVNKAISDLNAIFLEAKAWYLSERGMPYNYYRGRNALDYLLVKNETFLAKAMHFYEVDWKVLQATYGERPLPHPIEPGMELSPSKWARRGNFYLTAPHKLRHDIEQINYLLQLGRLPQKPFKELVQRYQLVLDEIIVELKEKAKSKTEPFNIDIASYILKPEQIQYMYATHNTMLYLYPGIESRQNGQFAHSVSSRGVINPYLDFLKIERRFHEENTGFIVVDNFVTKSALSFLYNYCLESTFWHAVKHGYLGAHHDDGFSHPILRNLVKEIYAKFPTLVNGLQLVNLWAYKSAQSHTGVPVHADEATVSFNFWITPDEANIDKDTGGLLIYPKEARKPPHWSFMESNGIDYVEQIQKRLAQYKATRIPYKQNRLVIFDSALFHKTDYFKFKKRYKDRRINLTIMFGKKNGILRKKH